MLNDTMRRPEWWDIRYYDSLHVGTQAGAEMALALLDLMQPLNVLSTQTVDDFRGASRASRMVQQGLDCSWYALHYVEEELRRFRGEGTFSFPLDLEARANLLKSFGRRLGHPGCY